MIYGLYLSATGVLANSHRQDVIANNLANSDTVGFKRSLAIFRERRTESSQLGKLDASNPTLETIGGGLLLSPTFVDRSEGQLERTTNNLDVAVHGRGFFAVQAGNETRLTRNGKFMIDRAGYLSLADGSGHHVLDANNKPIVLKDVPQSKINIGPDGSISTDGAPLARVGLFNVPDESLLTQQGGTLMNYPDMKKLTAGSGSIQSGYVENSNADPMTELTQLMNAQRQLEANANMIRSQDQTLDKLVNVVGKIG